MLIFLSHVASTLTTAAWSTYHKVYVQWTFIGFPHRSNAILPNQIH